MTARATAARYARALFDVALAERQDLVAIDRELSDFVRLMAENEALERALVHPAIPAARKRAVMEELLSRGALTPMLGRTLLLLADRDRLALLPELARAFRLRMMDHQNVVRAEVTTAITLPPEQVASLRQGLASATGREVQLETRVDPSILGGAVTRIGSTVYDGSITTQLAKLREQLAQAEA